MKTKAIATIAWVCGVVSLSAAVRLMQAPSGALLVLSKGDLTLAVVDGASLAVTGRVASGPDPHEVAASPDGRTAYIANYNGGDHIITVVDLTSMKPLAPIDLGPLRLPHGLAVAGGKLWFTAEGAKAIGRYDPAASKVDWVLGTGQDRTHMIYVAPDLSRIVTTNVNAATVTIADHVTGATTARAAGPPPGGAARAGPPAGARPGGPPPGGNQGDWEEVVVPVGRGDEGFDVTPDGREIWTANAEDGTVSVIDVASKKVTATIAANIAGANRLKFTPDGKRALISLLNSPDLVVLDVATRRTEKRLPIGHGAAGIEIQPGGARAFVSCTPDDYVAVIDLASLTMTGKIQAGRQPDGLTWVARH